MQKRRLDHLAQLGNLLFAAANVRVRHVRLLFDLHHGDGRIDFDRQRQLNLQTRGLLITNAGQLANLIFVPIDAYSHSLLNIGWRDGVGEIDDKFRELLHVDQVARALAFTFDDLRAPSDLKTLNMEKRSKARPT